jgi:hypothetical protein
VEGRLEFKDVDETLRKEIESRGGRREDKRGGSVEGSGDVS